MVTVSIQQGKLRGLKSKTDNGFEYCEFVGIPYAKPPVGSLRFKSPQAPEPWQGERDATTIDENNIALQIDDIFRKSQILGSEDCLYLNVYTPNLPVPGSKPLPVVVFIHGGGFMIGTGIMKDDGGPDFLIEQNLVIVKINYRLNVFGFLSLDIPEAAGNMGMKDQVKALEWVQNNINVFGGDKNNVTLIGASAGAASIDLLILSPLANGLFHKAVLHSGSSLNHWAVNYEPKSILVKLLEVLDFKGSVDNSYEIYDFLINIPAYTLVVAANKTSNEFISKTIYFGFVPTIESNFGNNDAFLTSNPYKLLKEGQFNHVPVIRGYCKGEGQVVKFFKPDGIKSLIERKNFVDHFAFKIEANEAISYNRIFLNLYKDNINFDDENDKFAVDFFTDLSFVAGIWVAGKMMASKEFPLYMFMFSYDGQSNLLKKMLKVKTKDAIHCDDLGYLFTHRIVKLENQADITMKTWLTKMWANFARTGKPTPDDDPIHWPAYSKETSVYLNIDKQLKIERAYESKKIGVFKEIYEKYEK